MSKDDRIIVMGETRTGMSKTSGWRKFKVTANATSDLSEITALTAEQQESWSKAIESNCNAKIILKDNAGKASDEN